VELDGGVAMRRCGWWIVFSTKRIGAMRRFNVLLELGYFSN